MTPTDILFDGRPADLAQVSLKAVWNAFQFGAGLFETVRIEQSQPQFLDRHLVRLRLSLAALTFITSPPPELLDLEHVHAAIRAVIGSESCFSGVAKLIVADGHVLVSFRAFPADLGRRQTDGVTLDAIAHTYRSSDELRRHKTLSYLTQYAVMRDGVLFANERDEVCESPTANIFAWLDDRVVTPPSDAPCLPGIVRGLLVERGEFRGLLIREERLGIDALRHARGAVLTNALVVAAPVRSFLGRDMPDSFEMARRIRDCIAIANIEFSGNEPLKADAISHPIAPSIFPVGGSVKH